MESESSNLITSGGASEGVPETSESSGISLGDVSITIFRHKWLILGFVCLGLVAAAAVRFLRPPPYVSWAKVMVLYVETGGAVGPPDPNRNTAPIELAQNAINSEVEILRSADVASTVAAIVGPERILAARGGGTNLEAAAGVVYSGIEVDNPKGTAILTVSFRHRDKNLVQPILNEIMATYMKKHQQVRTGGERLDGFYARKSDELHQKLNETEQELKRIRTNVLVGASIEETKRALQTELMKWHGELDVAEVDLATRQAVMGDATAGIVTNATGRAVSPDEISDYSDTVKYLEDARRTERALLLKYTPGNPVMITTKAQIADLNKHRLSLEQEFPGLPQLASALAHGGGTNGASTDLDELKKLTAKIRKLNVVISNLQADADVVLNLEPRINELTRQRDQLLTNQTFFATAVERAIVERELGAGAGNMSPVQTPTPPELDKKKLTKLMGGAFGACTACGFALAFLIDFVLLRTIRRSADIERHMRMPVFLSIPDTAWSNRPRIPWNGGGGEPPDGPDDQAEADGAESTPVELPVEVWRSGNELEGYVAGLRERLMTYFEVNNLNQKKPKLVAVTGCASGSGVSTLSSGLAAALSETGTGNVLLVDMTNQAGNTQAFFKGQPGAPLTESMAAGPKGETRIRENLYLAKIDESASPTNNDRLSRALPAGFGHLVPALKASDYDYVIFDMPPVSPTSSTARLASHMDLVLMVVESEKTGKQVAARASTLLRESKVKVAAVLNKYRQHVPAAISPEP